MSKISGISGDFGAQPVSKFNGLSPDSLRIGTGKFSFPNREFSAFFSAPY